MSHHGKCIRRKSLPPTPRMYDAVQVYCPYSWCSLFTIILCPVQSFDVEFTIPLANTVIGMECLGLAV